MRSHIDGNEASSEVEQGGASFGIYSVVPVLLFLVGFFACVVFLHRLFHKSRHPAASGGARREERRQTCRKQRHSQVNTASAFFQQYSRARKKKKKTLKQPAAPCCCHWGLNTRVLHLKQPSLLRVLTVLQRSEDGDGRDVLEGEWVSV